jgi:hypothetical protein
MTAVLFEDERKLLSDELGPRHSALSSRTSQQLVCIWIKGDGRSLFPRECHESNMTSQHPLVNSDQVPRDTTIPPLVSELVDEAAVSSRRITVCRLRTGGAMPT